MHLLLLLVILLGCQSNNHCCAGQQQAPTNTATTTSSSSTTPTGGIVPPSVFVFKSRYIQNQTNYQNLRSIGRWTLPYGPDISASSSSGGSSSSSSTTNNAGSGGGAGSGQVYGGYGYGMEAAHKVVLDQSERYLYAASSLGYMTVSDYNKPNAPIVTPYGFQIQYNAKKLAAMAICNDPGYLFAVYDTTLYIYKTVNRDNPRVPVLLRTVQIEDSFIQFQQSHSQQQALNTVFQQPQLLLLHTNCTKSPLSLSEKAPAYGLSSYVALVRNPLLTPSLSFVRLDSNPSWDDGYLLQQGLHMPLTANALAYWDQYSPWSSPIEDSYRTYLTSTGKLKYHPAVFLHPQHMVWIDSNENEILINLPYNNGMLRMNLGGTPSLVSVSGYGLRDHSEVLIDLNANDGTCSLKKYPDVFSLRNPSVIQTFQYNDKTYLITANLGEYASYRFGLTFQDAIPANQLFVGNNFTLPLVQVPKRILNRNSNKTSSSQLFSSNCQGPNCVGNVMISLGSSSIDFESSPGAPIFYRMVLLGGRGWSIYELPTNPLATLQLIYDSADALERLGCIAYPWSHNGGVDQRFAPRNNMPNHSLWDWTSLNNKTLQQEIAQHNNASELGCLDQGDGTAGACPMSQTVDRTTNWNGPGLGTITLGVACGRLWAVMSNRMNSLAYMYDMTDLAFPIMRKVFHLAEATRNASPGLAYNRGQLGEIDPRHVWLIPYKGSPTGFPMLLWAGIESGTVSMWQFDCRNPDNYLEKVVTKTTSSFNWNGWVYFGVILGLFLIFISALNFIAFVLGFTFGKL